MSPLGQRCCQIS